MLTREINVIFMSVIPQMKKKRTTYQAIYGGDDSGLKPLGRKDNLMSQKK